MARRIGGLVISRKMGESIQLDYPNGRREIILVESMVRDGAKVIISEHPYDLLLGDSVAIPGLTEEESDTGIYLESVEGGRAAIRVIADDRIRILRSELLRR